MVILNVIFYLVSIVTAVGAFYVNNWDQPFDFSCPAGRFISYISSVHDNHYEDRRWEFLCRTAPGALSSCVDSGYVNNFDQPVFHMCPGNKVMTGMYSYHDNHHEDRRFGFRCCDVDGRVPANCDTTDYVNGWDDKMTLAVPEGQAIKGAFSHHDDHYEDRLWKYQLCTI